MISYVKKKKASKNFNKYVTTTSTVRFKDARTDRNKEHGLFLRIKFLFGKETGTQEACKYVNVLPGTHTRAHTHNVHSVQSQQASLSLLRLNARKHVKQQNAITMTRNS